MKSLPPTVAIENTISTATATSLRSLDPTRERHTQISKTITAIINNPIKLIFKR